MVVLHLQLLNTVLPHPRFPVPSFCRSGRIYMRKMSSDAAAPTPKLPKFIPVEQTEITSISKSQGNKFRVASYNILAQVYVKSSLFPHSPRSCLRWHARSQDLLKVFKSLEADILCLQELDEFDSFYKTNMESLGYSSIYIQRSGEKRDGCGIFYNPNIVEQVSVERIEYNDLVDAIQEPYSASSSSDEPANKKAEKDVHTNRGDPNDPRVRLKRDCVGIMAAFRLKGPSHHLVVVANTHIYWDPKWADVKLAQVKYLLSRLSKYISVVSEKFECNPSVIVTGDFNSIPGDKVYQYLTSGDPSSNSYGDECFDELPIPLCSVYAYARGKEPTFTNCTPDFTNTLDYILFSPSERIKPVSLLELPELNSPDVAGFLPNMHHPSDHLPIGADFEVMAD